MSVERYFWPLQDITAYELAFILMHVGGHGLHRRTPTSFTKEQWLALDPQIKRHFALNRWPVE